MRTSGAVFKFAIAISLTFAVLIAAMVPFLEPGSEPWVISVFTLVIVATTFTIAAVGLYRGWDPFRVFEEY